MKILVTDDSRVMRRIVVRALRQAGYADHVTLEAADGLDALDQVLREDPDLVLSDWNMPEMTGIELLDALRRAGRTVPFGFVTSEGSEELRTRAASSGAAFFITKPFEAEDFATALRPVLPPGPGR